MKCRMTGVTLIELMVVVAILAIIASIAVPSYRSYLLRAQRSDAMAALLRVRTAQEKFFLQNNTYTNQFGPAGLNLQPAAGTTLTSENSHYQITVAPAPPTNTFIATATAQGGQTADTSCTTFTINEQGVRGSSPSAVSACWK